VRTIKHSLETEEQRVAAGAVLLDEARPGWENEIDIPHLDMRLCSRCIIGQLFDIADYVEDHEVVEFAGENEYRDGLAVLGLGDMDEKGRIHDSQAADFGFDIFYGGRSEWSRLTSAWVSEIEARRA